MTSKLKSIQNKSKIINYLKPILYSNKYFFIIANISILITASIQAYIPFLCGKMIDSLSNNSFKEYSYFSIFTILIIISTFFSFLRVYSFSIVSERMVYTIKTDHFSKIIYNKQVFFDNHKSGELINRFSSDMTTLKNVFTTNITGIIRNVIQLIASLVLLLYLSKKLLVIMLLIITPTILIIIFSFKYIKKFRVDYQEQQAYSTGILSEAFNNIKIIKAFVNESIEVDRFTDICCSIFTYGKKEILSNSIFISLINLLSFSAVMFIIYQGGIIVYNGELSQGELSSFIIYSITLSATLLSLSSSSSDIVSGMVILDDILKLTDERNSEYENISISDKQKQNHERVYGSRIKNFIVSAYNAIFNNKKEYDSYIKINDDEIKTSKSITFEKITFQNVNFKYNNSFNEESEKDILINSPVLSVKRKNSKSDKPTSLNNCSTGDYILKKVSFSIKKGSKIGIVGSSGGGKTSLINILLRYYDISSGDIIIDSNSIYSYNIKEYRRLFGLVTQEPLLFSNNIQYNIAYSNLNDNFSKSKFEKAVKNSYSNEFIYNKSLFPNAEDTIIGEKGVRLSGGQKQRLCIARAMYSNPSIYIFDEATSSLDSISESYVQKAIEKITENGENTVIIIAHRLSTIINCDEIIVFKNGEIVEKGRHNDLIIRNESEYKKLFDMQCK